MTTAKTGQMSKLLKLKTWLSLTDAAKNLSIMSEEEVTEADVLRFSLDGHLRLSIYFINDSKAKFGTIVPYEEVLDLLSKKQWFHDILNNMNIEKQMRHLVADSLTSDAKAAFIESTGLSFEHNKDDNSINKSEKAELLASFPPLDIFFGTDINEDDFFRPNGELTNIDGIWDLKMTGTGRAEIERRYQTITGGLSVFDADAAGIIVENQSGDICQLQRSYKYHQFEPGTMVPVEVIKHHLAMTLFELKSEKEFLSLYKKHKENQEELSSEPQYYPSGIPEDSMLVVRTSALHDLHNKLSDENSEREKPLGTRERDNLLKTIIGMAIMGYGYDVKSKKSTIPQEIVDDLAKVNISLSVDTIRTYLNNGSEFI